MSFTFPPAQKALPAPVKTTARIDLSSLISLGYIWLQYIEISLAKLKKQDESFYKSKIETGNFFLTKLLGETQVLCQNIKSGGKYYNDYNDKYFETAI